MSGLAAGLWAAYIAASALNTPTLCPLNGCTASWSALAQVQEIAGGLLVVVSLVSLAGIRQIFVLGAILAALLLATLFLAWGTYASASAELAAVLSVLALGTDAVASRPSRGLAEKDSPLNLPVFG